MFQYVPQELLPRLVDLTPFVLVVLRKGPHHGEDKAIEIIQGEHLPYIFKLRDDGFMLLSFSIMDTTDIAAISIFNTQSKAEVKDWLEGDPAVQQGIFTYEILSGMGMKGDTLC